MKTELKSILARSSGTLVPDALGLASIVLMLIVALHLPTYF
ncbi:MAG: hypothetical protein WBO29_12285 [Albidovulum sp.]